MKFWRSLITIYSFSNSLFCQLWNSMQLILMIETAENCLLTTPTPMKALCVNKVIGRLALLLSQKSSCYKGLAPGSWNIFKTQVLISIILKMNICHKIMFGINHFHHNIETPFKAFFLCIQLQDNKTVYKFRH